MRILTRYLLRAHLGPFLFALGILTGLLFVNYVAMQIEHLSGKGLSWAVIGRFLLLSLPHILALTLPMAVLVAVLYTWSQLASENELTALRASGFPIGRLLRPPLAVATFFCLLLIGFNNWVLPSANLRLRALMNEIAARTPALLLRERTINEIPSSDGSVHYWLEAETIDPQLGILNRVTIWDLGDTKRVRLIQADSGKMEFNHARTDLYLTLWHGFTQEADNSTPERFTRSYFDAQVVRVPGVRNSALTIDADSLQPADREMTLEQLIAARRGRAEQLTVMRGQLAAIAITELQRTIDGPAPGLSTGAGNGVAATATSLSEGRQFITPVEEEWRIANVEIHKKFALAVSVIAFVLIGAPLAVRFPGGGVGMVISASIPIFAIYWVGLIAGESLARSGEISPFVAMWGTNLVLFAVGIVASLRLSRSTSHSRSGGFSDLLTSIRSTFARRPA